MESVFVCRWQDKGNDGYISPIYACLTKKATDLCIYDIAEKLKVSGCYDIGGTYTNNEQSEFWFYYTTTMSHGYNFLLSLFVLPRKPTSFTLTLPKSKRLSSVRTANDTKFVICYGPETQLTFNSSKIDEHIYVKTYQFGVNEINHLDNCMLYIPITIQVHQKPQLNKDIVRRIKLNHNFSSLMNDKTSTDLVLESSSKKKYPVHKILLAAHSPILRSLLKKEDKVLPLDISDDVIEIMIEFIYTGSLANLCKQDCLTLLDTAVKLQLESLFELAQKLLEDEINVQNAINVAILAKKYKLETLTIKVFDFIKKNPEVLVTEGWHELEDIQLIKQLLRFVHPRPLNDLKDIEMKEI